MDRPARLFLEVKAIKNKTFYLSNELISSFCGFVVCLGRDPEETNGTGKSGYESRGLNFSKLSQQVFKLLQQVKAKIFNSY